MTKVTYLSSGKTVDTNVKTVELYQIVQLVGYSGGQYVVYDIKQSNWGYSYFLINLSSCEFSRSNHIRPLSEKFGIGMYYNDKDPQFMTAEQVAELKTKADERRDKEDAERRAAKAERDRIAEIGAQRLREIMPQDVKGVILAQCNETEYTDPSYECSTTTSTRTVILGFSDTSRNGFSELRKAARNSPDTAHLAECNDKFEHRDSRFILGESPLRGWSVSKMTHCTYEGFMDALAYTAGIEGNICVKAPQRSVAATPAETVEGVRVEIVDYSAKAIAVFGDTKPIKHILGSMHGMYRAYLTHNGGKCPGWIFSKKQEPKVREKLAPYLFT